MNKKSILLIGIALLILCLISIFNLNKNNTLENELSVLTSDSFKIIAEDKTDKGTLFFAYNENEDVLRTSFIGKNLFGYKTLYSSVGTDITKASESLGLTYHYFLPIKQSSLPLYFGVIGNDEVKEVKIKESTNESGWKSAKIIKADNKRIWLLYMNGFTGSTFDIFGVSEDGKDLVNIYDNFSPWTADQKPVRSPYK